MSIYLVFASIASIASITVKVKLVFVCFTQQSFSSINNIGTSSIKSIANTSFALQVQQEHYSSSNNYSWNEI